MQMRGVFLLPLLFALPACGSSEEQEQDMAKCRATAARVSGDAAANTRACMDRKGYHFNGGLNGCREEAPYQTAACYTR